MSLAGGAIVHGWGSWYVDSGLDGAVPVDGGESDQWVAYESGAAGIIQLNAYWVWKDWFHLGGYAGYAGGTSAADHEKNGLAFFSFGPSVKIGKAVGQRVWLGAAVDVGASFWFPEGLKTHFGFHIFPRFHTDLLLSRIGDFSFGVFADIGAVITPFAGRKESDYYSTTYSTMRQIQPALMFGLTLGG